MSLLDRNELALRRLRDLQPIPAWVITVLSILANPFAWLVILVVAYFQGTRFQLWSIGASSVILLPVILILFFCARRLARDIEPDTRGLPAQVEGDRELQRAVERLTRNGAIIRAGQREVIDEYVKSHYESTGT